MAYATGTMRSDERAVVGALMAESLSSLRAAALPDRQRWSYEENPAGPAETVVARYGTPEVVVGCGSIYPRRLRAGGKDLRAAIPADFAVHRGHRIGGAAVAIQRRLLQDGAGRFPFFIAFPNRAALPVLRRVGYQPIATALAWVKPLRAAYKVEARLGTGPLAHVVSMPADFALAGADAWRQRRWRPGASEIVGRADERFDRLWCRARDGYAVTGERTAAYLTWRYRAGAEGHRFFCLVDAAGELLGYIAFRVRERKAFIDDLFTTDMGDGAERLLLQFGDAMRRAGHQSVCLVYAGNPDFEGRLRRLGFFARPATERTLIGFAADPGYVHLLEDRHWYLFEGEMDV